MTYGLGELDPYMQSYYDERSHIDKAFENWNGSVYWIQGMQDWNVDPIKSLGDHPELIGIKPTKTQALT